MRHYKVLSLEITYSESFDIIKTSGTIDSDGNPVTGGITVPWKQNDKSSNIRIYNPFDSANTENYDM